MQQEDSLKYTDAVDTFEPGKTELINDGLGKVTFVGFSKEGDVVIQKDDEIMSLPELAFNLSGFEIPFQPETVVLNLTQGELDVLKALRGKYMGEVKYKVTAQVELLP